MIVALGVGFLPLPVAAEIYKVGDSFVGFAAPDQHGTSVTYEAGAAKFVLFDTPGESGQARHPQDPDWFAKNHVLLVINISDLSAIKRKAARSRMKSKPFQMLVVEDKEQVARFPLQEGKFTVLVLDDKGTISAIKFAAPGDELKAVVTGGKS